MKRILSLTVIICLFIGAAEMKAQNKKDNPMNYFKFNLASAVVKNYSFQYERVLTRGMTFGLGYRIMPESGLPLYSTFESIVQKNIESEDPSEDIEIGLENLKMQNFAVTPELRFYMGKKKYGRGFYFSLFYRYSQFEMSNVEIPFEGSAEQEITLTAGGKLKAHTGGFMFGSQWSLGKHICLDWWMLGPHAGVSKASLDVTTSAPLNETDQQDIRDGIEDFDVPMLKKDITVSSDGVKGNLDGPFAGIRTGLSLGIRF